MFSSLLSIATALGYGFTLVIYMQSRYPKSRHLCMGFLGCWYPNKKAVEQLVIHPTCFDRIRRVQNLSCGTAGDVET
mgnify:FL=1